MVCCEDEVILLTVWEREFHFLPLEEYEVSVTAWWMGFFCTHCLRNKMISCGCEAALFLLLWRAAAISTVTHYIHCMIGLQRVWVGVSMWNRELQYVVLEMWMSNLTGHNFKTTLSFRRLLLANVCSDKWNTRSSFASKQFRDVQCTKQSSIPWIIGFHFAVWN